MTVNEKIAKWCGIRFQTLDDLNYRYRHAGNLKWVAPDGTILSTLPDFQNDFNACLKWAVPELNKKNYYFVLSSDVSRSKKKPVILYQCIIVSFNQDYIFHAHIHSIAATAFCNALIKLISEGK